MEGENMESIWKIAELLKFVWAAPGAWQTLLHPIKENCLNCLMALYLFIKVIHSWVNFQNKLFCAIYMKFE